MNTPRSWLSVLLIALFVAGGFQSAARTEEEPPNIVVIFADDLGYGDLSSYGHPTIKTPNLDQMADEGLRWTDFYSGAPVCTPSRAGLLTGRYAMRSGLAGHPRVFFEFSAGGLPPREITIAEGLKEKGYRTAAIGKWHLGHKQKYLPTNQGFDYYYGIPYSNDMRFDVDMPVADDVRLRLGMTREAMRKQIQKKVNWVPLYENEKVIEYPANQRTLTKRYTKKATNFIEENSDDRFFLYMPHTFPHTPLFASDQFRGTSRRGLYGDVVEELDWSVGQVLDTLREEGVAENTFVVFTSDNGPWLIKKQHGGTTGLLRGRKGSTYEGGMREPAIMWWPGTIEPDVVTGMGSVLDLFPTIMNLAGVEMPDDRKYDGYDLSPVLFGEGESPRNEMIYYRSDEIYAARKGPYKAHFITEGVFGRGPDKKRHDPPKLYNLNVDPAERFNIADQHPEVIKEIKQMVEEHKNSIKPVENQLEKVQEGKEDQKYWE